MCSVAHVRRFLLGVAHAGGHLLFMGWKVRRFAKVVVLVLRVVVLVVENVSVCYVEL